MRSFVAFLIFAAFVGAGASAMAASPAASSFDASFSRTVQPFLSTYCVSCHGKDSPEGDLDLSGFSTFDGALKSTERWQAIADKLHAGKMPPKKAKLKPAEADRQAVAGWFSAAMADQAERNAGDPGIVPIRRLSNSEYDYTIRDLTGVDLHPAKEFPVDPVNPAGFDNSGESLVMSPSLLNKYLQAAHEVANHLVLEPRGIIFAPYAMLAETDRDRFCVERIINFYHAQDTDYADYFAAAWRFKYRRELGEPDLTLAGLASQRSLSVRYLDTVWNALTLAPAPPGPLGKVQSLWNALPAPGSATPADVRADCEQLRDYVTQCRAKLEMRFLNLDGAAVTNSEPLLLWKNEQYATHRMNYDPAQLQVAGERHLPPASQPSEPGTKSEFGPGKTAPVHNPPGDPDLIIPAGQRARYEPAIAEFCRIFPDRFYMEERGRSYFDSTKDRGRYLSAGLHNLLGYFRDDQPLYELILTPDQQKELDGLWADLDFIASASSRTYIQFCNSWERDKALSKADDSFRVQDEKITSTASIEQFRDEYLQAAQGADPRALDAIRHYFDMMNRQIRWTEKARRDAEAAHLVALADFARRAYRRPLSREDQDDIVASYQSCRQAGLDHESAVRECLVDILMSPDMCYRMDLIGGEKGIHPLTDQQLACRLSYFLWSSLPDAQLLSHVTAGDLHQPRVLAAEARRMLRDPKIRALAVEFGGGWLDFKRFDEISSVDRDRFPAFTNDLRQAMYEEPIQALVDALQSNRSILDLIEGDYTFLTPVLADHYGIPFPESAGSGWTRVEGVQAYGRGGLLGMAAFMTKNSPGLRTSPVKRGNWVVKNVLGERIPAPPPNVPELPHDEAKLDLPLREVLARHRREPTCAACHARFDSFGLAFEGYGPVGERRTHDLAGHPIDASATFPGGEQGVGVAGLRDFIRNHRRKDFVDNLAHKMLAYALGRSLMLSDEPLLRELSQSLAKQDYRFDGLIEAIVTSRQFTHRRAAE